MACTSFKWIDGRDIDIQYENKCLNIRLDRSFLCRAVVLIDENDTEVKEFDAPLSYDDRCDMGIEFENIQAADSSSDQLLIFNAAMHHMFLNNTDVKTLQVRLSETANELKQTLLARGALLESDGALVCVRSVWWQLPDYWMTPGIADGYPLRYQMTDGKRHPVRRPIPDGILYASHAPSVGKTFRLEKVNVQKHLEIFHEWMNQKRVDHFWEESGDINHHQAYLEAALENPRTLPMIGYFDNEPAGYFEAYWVKEDRLAPYCNGTDFDRGMHLLIGNPAYLGKAYNNVWLPAVLHYMFLEDCRTQRLLGEPRADNKRLIRRLVDLGFHMEKEFDFPHKRAALMIISREVFFQQL